MNRIKQNRNKTRKFLRFASSLLICQLALPTLPIISLEARAQSVGIPDDIDVGKYQAIYQTAKQISDVKRGKANDIQQRATQSDRDLDSAKNMLSGNLRRISDNENLIARLSTEIPALNDENTQLNRDLSALRQILSQLNMQLGQRPCFTRVKFAQY